MALTKISGSVIKDSVSLSGNVSVGGTLTYQDVTNVDALGIGTFRTGIKVLAGGINAVGVITATSFSGSGANLTNLNASNIASGTVPTARLGSGTASSSTFLRGDSTFQTVNTDLVSDTSPQLGGNLDTNSFEINLDDNHAVNFGASADLVILHSGTTGVIQCGTGDLFVKTVTSGDDVIIQSVDDIELQPQGGEDGIKVIGNGAVELYHCLLYTSPSPRDNR